MALYNTRAVVLRSYNLSETDKIVTFLTERHGKIKCVAKGARKIKSRFGAALQPLSHIGLIYFAKENQTLFKLNHCDIIHSFQSLRDDFGKLYVGVYYTELCDTLVKEGGRGEELYRFLLDSLHWLNGQENMELLLRLFELRLISLLGYTPEMNHCVRCKKNPATGWIGFSYNRGGIICAACQEYVRPEVKFKPGTLSYLRKLLTLDGKQSERLKIPKAVEEEIESVTHRLVLSHAGRELKSYPFIKRMAAIMQPQPQGILCNEK